MSLRILSVFLTVDGEANVWGPGNWSVFVRTAGCGVGCHWCDTKYSWHPSGGQEFTPEALFEIVKQKAGSVKKVTLTGGEPLEQDPVALWTFLKLLLENKFNVTVETAGTIDTLIFRDGLAKAWPNLKLSMCQLTFVVDYKLKSSQFKGSMNFHNHFSKLRRGDVVKFVIGTEEDFEEAVEIAKELDQESSFLAAMYFSPQEGGEIPANELFFRMKEDGLDALGVGINLQLHKYIFPDDSREEEGGGLDFTKRSLGRDEYLRNIKNAK